MYFIYCISINEITNPTFNGDRKKIYDDSVDKSFKIQILPFSARISSTLYQWIKTIVYLSHSTKYNFLIYVFLFALLLSWQWTIFVAFSIQLLLLFFYFSPAILSRTRFNFNFISLFFFFFWSVCRDLLKTNLYSAFFFCLNFTFKLYTNCVKY